MLSSALHAGARTNFRDSFCFHSVVKVFVVHLLDTQCTYLITYLQRHHHLCTNKPKKKKNTLQKKWYLLFFHHVPNEVVPIQLFPKNYRFNNNNKVIKKWASKGFSKFHIDDVPIGNLVKFPSFKKKSPKVWHLGRKKKKMILKFCPSCLQIA